MDGCAAKNSTASSTLIASPSPTLLPRRRTVSVSGLKRAPPQASQGTFTARRHHISIFFCPWPSHASQRPPEVLNEKRLALQPRMRASLVSAKRRRMLSQKPTYVAGQERGVLPTGVWSTSSTRSTRFTPFSASQPIAAFCRSDSYSTSRASVDLPEPETPVTTTSRSTGTSTLTLFKL